MGAAAAVGRLHYECEVIMTSTIRPTVETPDTSTPKAISFAEKSARMDQMRMRLQGLNITGAGEPSHSLLDECVHEFETRDLKYLEPARCTSRENEITSGRTDKKLKLDAGSLSIKESKAVPDETVSTTWMAGWRCMFLACIQHLQVDLHVLHVALASSLSAVSEGANCSQLRHVCC